MEESNFIEFMHALGFDIKNLPKVGRREMKFGSKENWLKFGEKLEELRKINIDKELSDMMRELNMECICKIEMMHLVSDYDGNENLVGDYFYCRHCGRIFYKDKRNNHDWWLEPDCVTGENSK